MFCGQGRGPAWAAGSAAEGRGRAPPLESMLAARGPEDAESLLREAGALERKLVVLLEANGAGGEQYNGLRRKVRKHYAQLILWHHKEAQEHDVEASLWKNVYYRQLEILRRRIRTTQLALNNNDKQDDKMTAKLKKDAVAFLNLLDSANFFYKGLMKELQVRHGSVGAIGHPDATPPPSLPSNEKPSVDVHATCGRILTILGDLTRYRGEVSQKLAAEVDPAPPEWFYKQAARVWPEGGQPLNQLAVMALHKRKHLQSAYYYARALSSEHHFPQAHGNLTQLWERNQRACNNLAQDAGDPIGHGRPLCMALEGLALRIEKVVMMVYEGQVSDDFNSSVDDVVADVVSVLRAPDFYDEFKQSSPSCNPMFQIAVLAIFGMHCASSSFPGNLPRSSGTRSQGPQGQRHARSLFLHVATALLSAVGWGCHGRDVGALLLGPAFVILSWSVQHVFDICGDVDDDTTAGFWISVAQMAASLTQHQAPKPGEGRRPIPEELELRSFLPLTQATGDVDFDVPVWEGEPLEAARGMKLWGKCEQLARTLHGLLRRKRAGQRMAAAMERIVVAVLQSRDPSGTGGGKDSYEAPADFPASPWAVSQAGASLLAGGASASVGTSACSRLGGSVSSLESSGVTSGVMHVTGGLMGVALEDEDIEGEIVMYKPSIDVVPRYVSWSPTTHPASHCPSPTSSSKDSCGPLASPPARQKTRGLPGADLRDRAQRGGEDLVPLWGSMEGRVKAEYECSQDGEGKLVISQTGIDATLGGSLESGHSQGLLGRDGAGLPLLLSPVNQDIDGDEAHAARQPRASGKVGCDEADEGQGRGEGGLGGGIGEHMGLASPARENGSRGAGMGPLCGGTEGDGLARGKRAVDGILQGQELSTVSVEVAETAADVLNDVFPISREDLISQLNKLAARRPVEGPKGQPSEPDANPPSAPSVGGESAEASAPAGMQAGPEERVELQGRGSAGAAALPAPLPGVQQPYDYSPSDSGPHAVGYGHEPGGRDDLIDQLSELYMNRGGNDMATGGMPAGFDPVVGAHASLACPPPAALPAFAGVPPGFPLASYVPPGDAQLPMQPPGPFGNPAANGNFNQAGLPSIEALSTGSAFGYQGQVPVGLSTGLLGANPMGVASMPDLQNPHLHVHLPRGPVQSDPTPPILEAVPYLSSAIANLSIEGEGYRGPGMGGSLPEEGLPPDRVTDPGGGILKVGMYAAGGQLSMPCPAAADPSALVAPPFPGVGASLEAGRPWSSS
ncbi:unnamed protein product [Ostreobium quekettii]|uniref:Protein SMG7 n=1 Tax=Ostreobium quekettii TaxID=121088 RepID=A0A8S1J4L5_9CHLO|nr:unnamed protein product [Ostreobium quekettii]|eukprot:evm.model.scf_1324.1 EVM.evm.TU.scf_1324.1   scf_1324:2071-9005(+)